MSNKTTFLFNQKLSIREKDNDIVRYSSGEEEPEHFFGSFTESLCFLLLIICVCIIIYGLKYANGDFQRSTKDSENLTLPNKLFEAKDAEQPGKNQRTYFV